MSYIRSLNNVARGHSWSYLLAEVERVGLVGEIKPLAIHRLGQRIKITRSDPYWSLHVLIFPARLPNERIRDDAGAETLISNL